MSKIELMDLRVVNRLIEGRARIEKGWCQGKLRGWGGEVCMMGSVLEFERKSYWSDPLYKQAVTKLWQAIEFSGGVPKWNDAPGRKKEEIIAAFDKAIELATQEAMEKINV